MTLNPNHISPPEPDPYDVADCDYCGDEYYKEDMVDLGHGHGWCCEDHICLKQALIDTISRAMTAEIIVKRLREANGSIAVTTMTKAGPR